MALTPEEQAELDALEAEFGQAAPAAPGLSPEEEAELLNLQIIEKEEEPVAEEP